MIKALIVDDELKSRTLLAYYISTMLPEIGLIKQAASVDEALEILKQFRPAIIFLDIAMPGKNGFDLLHSIPEPDFDVIFVTAFDQYAIQAIRSSALDYLLKPVDPTELVEAVRRSILKSKRDEEKKQQLKNLIFNIGRSESQHFRLTVPTIKGHHFFMADEIVRFQSDRNYTRIVPVGQRPFVCSRTLKYFEDLLAPINFIRTHKSHLVNFEQMVKLTENQEYVILKDGFRVEVSKKKREEVNRILKLRK